MIVKLCKNISVIIVGIIIAITMFKFGQCSRGKPSQIPETVFKTDTLIIEKPKVKFRIIEKIKWKIAKPETIQVVKYAEWMDSIYTAISLQIYGSTFDIIIKKDFNVLKKSYLKVPNSFIWYGTKTGDIMRYRRIRWDWLGWNKLTIGTKIYWNKDVNPYVRTGIRIKCIGINVGIDKESIYGDVNWRIW